MHSPGDTKNHFVPEIPADFSLDLPNIYSAEASCLSGVRKTGHNTDRLLLIHLFSVLVTIKAWPASSMHLLNTQC